MTDITERIAAALDAELERQQGINLPDSYLQWIDTNELAEAVVEELVSWDFLMMILDNYYPEDIFPTLVSLIRAIDQLRGVRDE